MSSHCAGQKLIRCGPHFGEAGLTEQGRGVDSEVGSNRAGIPGKAVRLQSFPS